MSLASVSIVIASLIIFGIFLLFAVNLSHNTRALKQQPELRVFCEYELDDMQVRQVEEAIKQNPEVAEYEVITREQAFEKLKENLGENSSVLDGYDASILPVSFNITVKNLENGPKLVEELKQIPGVRKVSYSRELTDLISKLTNWINLISVVLVILLMVFSISIIANTIKLTVFARRREIGIMKCIGATDWFIRGPFIVEGVIIGLVGAIAAFILTRMAYVAVESKFNSDLASVSMNFIRIVAVESVQYLVAGCYAMLGGLVGAVGSFISIRKYLKV